MAFEPMLAILFIVTVTKCTADGFNSYNSGNGASRFGELLKPPPLPPRSAIRPVPFHGGPGRSQRQNLDVGYHYQPPPPPPQQSVPGSSEFKFPAPFYKQYNFNFVPPPQPFSSTPSPSLFQKVSGWLFPSQQTDGYDLAPKNPARLNKDCNPCNLVPWIPVIRYDLGGKTTFQPTSNQLISNPTYGPPSPTAYADSQNVDQFKPQAFRSQQISTGIPHAVYGPPLQTSQSGNFIGVPSSTYGPPIATYGPPSPTHTVSLPPPSPISSTYSASSSSYSAPSSSYGVPSSSIGQPVSTYTVSSSSQGLSSGAYGFTSPAYTTPSPSTPFSPSPLSTSYGSSTSYQESNLYNDQFSQHNNINILESPDLELQLPKVTPSTPFKNSYGEAISNSYISDIPYSVSASAAESTKVKTEVLPNSSLPEPNASLALANPAPFSLNRGRNIHTLQPVALPNLSVSPLPPIFNARPFRPTSPNFLKTIAEGINSLPKSPNNVQIEQSVALAEFTHSVDYPATVVQSQVIDVDNTRQANQTKAYRNIPNAYIVNEIRDISSQASEDHLSATKTIQDASFESTGLDIGNDIYDSNMPSEFMTRDKTRNNNNEFADLRGVKDEDVDKFRTDNNLQIIDSPLLYLKPSAPHKGYGNFVIALSTPTNDHEYEMYDEIPTTVSPQLTTHTNPWDESRNDYIDSQPPPTAAQESVENPKFVQIIVPYTTGNEKTKSNFNYAQNLANWIYTQDEEYQPRKIPSNTEKPNTSTDIENYNTPTTTTENPTETDTESFDSERLNAAAILNDLYDVKEPPFDIIKLQHNIDDWTEQEYSEQHKSPQKNRGFEKYAKQIPDDYFTTTTPSSYVTLTNNFDYDYDHEGSSSIQHSITEQNNSLHNIKTYKDYNSIERPKPSTSSSNDDTKEKQKLHIYTAASSFRSTTTPAPWEKILTSISPLTKEKIYVVTSKPWRESHNVTTDWYQINPFESKKTRGDSEAQPSDIMPFKSPRFVNRPALGFTSDDNDSMNSDSSYGFSKSWYQSINDLENGLGKNHTAWLEGSTHQHASHLNEYASDAVFEDLRKKEDQSS